MTTEIRKKSTLAELIDALVHVDEYDDIAEAPLDMHALLGDVRQKVDAIKAVIDRLEAFEVFMTDKMEPLRRAKAQAAKHREGLRNTVKDIMESNRFEKLPGDMWKMSLVEGQEVVLLTREPDCVDFEDLPTLVNAKTTFSWNRDEVKKSLKKGVLLPFAKLHKVKSLRFYLNKDVKNAKTSAQLNAAEGEANGDER